VIFFKKKNESIVECTASTPIISYMFSLVKRNKTQFLNCG